MIITVKITELHPETQMEEIIQFLKQAEVDLQVIRVDMSGLESARSCYTGDTADGYPKGFCFATVQGTQSAVSSLSGNMLHGAIVEVIILSVTSQMPNSEYLPGYSSDMGSPHAQHQKEKARNERLHADGEKIKAFFHKTNQASSKFFQDLSQKMKPAMGKVGDAFKNIGKKKSSSAPQAQGGGM